MESYPAYLLENERVSGTFDDYVLENDRIAVTIASDSGRITSLRHKDTGVELVGEEQSAGFTYIETESHTSSAWNIGRYLRELPVDRCLRLERPADGPLRRSVKATWKAADSRIEATYSLDKYQSAVKIEVTADWHGIGGDTVPVLDYRIPLAYRPEDYQYDIPAGSIRRASLHNDVPGLRYGLARRAENPAAILISDSKYGYRGGRQEACTDPHQQLHQSGSLSGEGHPPYYSVVRRLRRGRPEGGADGRGLQPQSLLSALQFPPGHTAA